MLGPVGAAGTWSSTPGTPPSETGAPGEPAEGGSEMNRPLFLTVGACVRGLGPCVLDRVESTGRTSGGERFVPLRCGAPGRSFRGLRRLAFLALAQYGLAFAYPWRGVVEAVGIEPTSERAQPSASTCVSPPLVLAAGGPVGRGTAVASRIGSRPPPPDEGLGPACEVWRYRTSAGVGSGNAHGFILLGRESEVVVGNYSCLATGLTRT